MDIKKTLLDAISGTGEVGKSVVEVSGDIIKEGGATIGDLIHAAFEVAKETGKDTTELVESKGSSPAEMIRMAVEGKADLVSLKELLAIQKDYEANEARKAYHKAMAEFKANAPEIDKDKTVSFKTDRGQVGYSHASLFNVVKKISAELSKHGLSASWTTKQNGAVSVTCKITHDLGHSEETTLSAPADTSGSKNAIQSIGSTITYLERYTLLALTGLATFEQDDDGATSEKPTEYITEKEVGVLQDNIVSLKVNLQKFLDYMKVADLGKILKADYQKALNVLEGHKNRQAGKK